MPKSKTLLKIDGFHGMSDKPVSGKAYRAAGICNFRRDAGGALRKRCGYRLTAHLPGKVRAVWTGIIKDQHYIFAVSGNTVYRIFDDWSFAPAGDVAASPGGAVCFFFYNGELFILDGVSFYVFRSGSFEVSGGYVPLLYSRASMYSAPSPADYEEPVNMLTRRARVGYTANGVYNDLQIKFRVESIDAVYVGGRRLESDEYSYVNRANDCIVTFTDRPGTNYSIDISCTAEAGAMREAGSCHSAVVYGGANNSRLFCFGGDDKSKIYYNRVITDIMLAGARSRYPDASELYFPSSNIFYVGDGRYDVTAACRHYDRLLIFTENDAWVTDFSSSKFEDYPAVPINSGVGCRSYFGAHLAGNDPVTVSEGGIYRWTSNTSLRDECNAALISASVEPHCGRDYFKGALSRVFTGRDELWLSNNNYCTGCYIYNFKHGDWTFFNGFRADGFFDYHGEAGFFTDGRIYIFDESLDYDIPENGFKVNIRASWLSDYLDFGSPGNCKRILRLKLFGGAEGGGSAGRISVKCSTDRNFDKTLDFDFEETPRPQHFEERTSLGRLNYLQFELISEGSFRPTVRGICFDTNSLSKRN